MITCLNTSNRQLSTGFWSVIILSEVLNICSELRLFGFLAHAYPSSTYHYFNSGYVSDSTPVLEHYNSRSDRRGGHNFAMEQTCLLQCATEVDTSRFRRATNARLSCATRRARGVSNVRDGRETSFCWTLSQLVKLSSMKRELQPTNYNFG